MGMGTDLKFENERVKKIEDLEQRVRTLTHYLDALTPGYDLGSVWVKMHHHNEKRREEITAQLSHNYQELGEALKRSYNEKLLKKQEEIQAGYASALKAVGDEYATNTAKNAEAYQTALGAKDIDDLIYKSAVRGLSLRLQESEAAQKTMEEGYEIKNAELEGKLLDEAEQNRKVDKEFMVDKIDQFLSHHWNELNEADDARGKELLAAWRTVMKPDQILEQALSQDHKFEYSAAVAKIRLLDEKNVRLACELAKAQQDAIESEDALEVEINNLKAQNRVQKDKATRKEALWDSKYRRDAVRKTMGMMGSWTMSQTGEMLENSTPSFGVSLDSLGDSISVDIDSINIPVPQTTTATGHLTGDISGSGVGVTGDLLHRMFGEPIKAAQPHPDGIGVTGKIPQDFLDVGFTP